MTWVLIVVGAWLAVAAVTALLIGRAVHTADVIEHTDGAPAALSQDAEDDVPPAPGLIGHALPLPRTALADR